MTKKLVQEQDDSTYIKNSLAELNRKVQIIYDKGICIEYEKSI